MEASLRKPAGIALSAMCVLFIGAIIFYKERLFADTSYVAFGIITNKSLFIQNQRLGSFITQIVPYFFLKLHLPLSAILLGYSASFNLFFLTVAAILFFWLRQYSLVIIMSLYYLLIVSDSYFLANDEIHQAVSWMFLMFGVINYFGEKKINILFLLIPVVLLAFATFSAHFLVIIPTVFLWVYFIIGKKNWPHSKNNTILLSALLIVVIVFKFWISAGSQPYEQEHLHHVTHFSLQDIIDCFTTPIILMFLYRCLTNYWTAVIIFGIGIAALVKGKQKILLVWTIICCIGYFILMGLTYSDLDKYARLCHMETEWESLGIIFAAPFVFNYLPKAKQNISIVLLLLVFITRFAYIGNSSRAFTWRLHFHEQVLALMKKKGITKLGIIMEKKVVDKEIIEWTVTYESLFTSAMNGDKPQSTFLYVNKDDKQTLEAISNPKGFFNVWSMLPPNQMNSEYFSIDTTRPYQIMTYNELIK